MRQIRIVKLSDSNAEFKWDEYVKAHPFGTPFHLTAWKGTIENSFGHRPEYLMAEDETDGAVVGILPLFFAKSLLFGKMLISTPQASYGGILSSLALAEEALYKRARQLALETLAGFIEFRSFQNTLAYPYLETKDLYV